MLQTPRLKILTLFWPPVPLWLFTPYSWVSPVPPQPSEKSKTNRQQPLPETLDALLARSFASVNAFFHQRRQVIIRFPSWWKEP